MNQNSLSGTVPRQWDLPLLSQLTFANNQLGGELPPDLFAHLPKIEWLDFSSNRFVGPVPSAPSLRVLRLLALSDNQFSGPLPANLTSQTVSATCSSHLLPSVPFLPDHCIFSFFGLIIFLQLVTLLTVAFFLCFLFCVCLPFSRPPLQYDLSYNNLSGPLILRGVPLEDLVMTKLNLAMTRGLECPIRLGGLDVLRTLDLRGAGFDGCDFEDQSMVQLPQKSIKELDVSPAKGGRNGAETQACVSQCMQCSHSPPSYLLLTVCCCDVYACVLVFSCALQISHNNWLPMTLPLYPSLVRVTAIRASVRALSFQSVLDLQELTLDHSLIRPPPPSQQSQTAVFEDLCRRAPHLRYLSCNNCSLQVEQTTHI
jgi:hypothetical protein